MIRFIIFRFWPAFLPLIIYLVWHYIAVRKAKKEGKPPPHFRSRPLYWAIVVGLLMAAFLFVLMGLEQDSQKGVYVPPSFKDGKIIPGRVEP